MDYLADYLTVVLVMVGLLVTAVLVSTVALWLCLRYEEWEAAHRQLANGINIVWIGTNIAISITIFLGVLGASYYMATLAVTRGFLP